MIEEGYVEISMKNYVIKALQKLQYSFPKKHNRHRINGGHQYIGRINKYAPEDDTSRKLEGKEIKRVQSVVGTFLFYARAIENTILPTINEIAAYQASPIEKTNDKITMLLDYLSTYSYAKIRFNKSNIILHIEPDAAYLVAPKFRSRISVFYYCGQHY